MDDGGGREVEEVFRESKSIGNMDTFGSALAIESGADDNGTALMVASSNLP